MDQLLLRTEPWIEADDFDAPLGAKPPTDCRSASTLILRRGGVTGRWASGT